MAEEKDYKINQIGPVETYSWNKDGKDIAMKKYALQLEGEEDWVKLNQSAETAEPKEGDTIRGHIEDDPKFGRTFRKERKGWGGGGRGTSPGAIWSSAVETAVHVVNAYIEISGKKPKSMEEYLARVEQTAPEVNKMVDRLAGAAKPAETTTNTEAGETEEEIDVGDLNEDKPTETKADAKSDKDDQVSMDDLDW